MRILLVLSLLFLCVHVAEQRRGFGWGVAVGAGVALTGAAIGYRAGRRSHNNCWSCGGYYGGGYGRRRRAVASPSDGPPTPLRDLAAPLPADPRLETAQMDAYFGVVAAEDLAGCGLRLVCELAAAPERAALPRRQRLILSLFGADGPRSQSPDSPKQAYDAAHELGTTTGSPAACASVYPDCPVGAEEIMAALEYVRAQTGDHRRQAVARVRALLRAGETAQQP